MNARETKAYLLKKYGYRVGNGDHWTIDELIPDEADRELAIDLELRLCARYEREAVRSGRMTREQILEGQAKAWREVYRQEIEKAIVR